MLYYRFTSLCKIFPYLNVQQKPLGAMYTIFIAWKDHSAKIHFNKMSTDIRNKTKKSVFTVGSKFTYLKTELFNHSANIRLTCSHMLIHYLLLTFIVNYLSDSRILKPQYCIHKETSIILPEFTLPNSSYSATIYLKSVLIFPNIYI